MHSKKPIAVLIALLATVGMTSCSPAADDAQPSSTVTPWSEPSETPDPLPAVSLQTTCDLLFGSSVDGPIADAQDIITRFVETPDLSTITEDELESTIASLETAGKNAEDSISPYIDAQIAPLQQLLDTMRGSSNTAVDLADYKAAGLEMINQCERFL